MTCALTNWTVHPMHGTLAMCRPSIASSCLSLLHTADPPQICKEIKHVLLTLRRDMLCTFSIHCHFATSSQTSFQSCQQTCQQYSRTAIYEHVLWQSQSRRQAFPSYICVIPLAWKTLGDLRHDQKVKEYKKVNEDHIDIKIKDAKKIGRVQCKSS